MGKDEFEIGDVFVDELERSFSKEVRLLKQF